MRGSTLLSQKRPCRRLTLLRQRCWRCPGKQRPEASGAVRKVPHVDRHAHMENNTRTDTHAHSHAHVHTHSHTHTHTLAHTLSMEMVNLSMSPSVTSQRLATTARAPVWQKLSTMPSGSYCPRGRRKPLLHPIISKTPRCSIPRTRSPCAEQHSTRRHAQSVTAPNERIVCVCMCVCVCARARAYVCLKMRIQTSMCFLPEPCPQ